MVGVKKVLSEIGFNDAKLGVMVETPAAVQLIKDFCEEGIDFISFGTNDLTQYILAVDRGNEKVQDLYNELHPAVLHQLAYVIRICKRYKVESSICGQAGSKPEMAKFLVENNIDSISVNADVAKKISDYVKEIEEEKVKGTDKEPRQYERKKEENVNTGEKEVDDIDKMDEGEKEYYEENKEKIDSDIEKIEEEKKSFEGEEKSSEEVDSTKEEIPEDVTKEELMEDQHRPITDEEKKESEGYEKEADKDSEQMMSSDNEENEMPEEKKENHSQQSETKDKQMTKTFIFMYDNKKKGGEKKD